MPLSFLDPKTAMRPLLIVGFVMLTMAGGYAAPSDVRLPDPHATASSHDFRPGDTAAHVRVVSVQRDNREPDKVAVTVDIDRGFHINANPASYDYLIPTTLNATNHTPLRVIYPSPVRFKPKFADEALDVYEGTVRIIAEFPPGALTRKPYLFGTVTAQACTDEICLPPADLPLPHR
jgi:uncharacterized protein